MIDDLNPCCGRTRLFAFLSKPLAWGWKALWCSQGQLTWFQLTPRWSSPGEEVLGEGRVERFAWEERKHCFVAYLFGARPPVGLHTSSEGLIPTALVLVFVLKYWELASWSISWTLKELPLLVWLFGGVFWVVVVVLGVYFRRLFLFPMKLHLPLGQATVTAENAARCPSPPPPRPAARPAAITRPTLARERVVRGRRRPHLISSGPRPGLLRRRRRRRHHHRHPCFRWRRRVFVPRVSTAARGPPAHLSSAAGGSARCPPARAAGGDSSNMVAPAGGAGGGCGAVSAARLGAALAAAVIASASPQPQIPVDLGSLLKAFPGPEGPERDVGLPHPWRGPWWHLKTGASSSLGHCG